MRTNQIVTAYIATLVFSILAVRAFLAWNRQREARAAHLALATGAYGVSRFISAITTHLYDSLAGHVAPRWTSVLSGILTIIAFYLFIRFLFDFIAMPTWVHPVIVLGSLFFAVLSILEHTSTKIVAGKFIFSASPISFTPYLYLIVAWYLLVSGILWVSFAVYGFKTAGLARFRLLSISGGFLLFFLVIGILPLLLIRNTTEQIRGLASILGYVLLASAPLLLVGFSPPAWITRKFHAKGSTGTAAAS